MKNDDYILLVLSKYPRLTKEDFRNCNLFTSWWADDHVLFKHTHRLSFADLDVKVLLE